MKKRNIFKKLLALTASALMLAAIPNANVLTVSADEPVTYHLMYEGSENGEGHWYYQLGEWTNEGEHREFYYMQETLKNGDIVVVENAAPSQLTLNVHLSNLTIKNTSGALAMVSVTGGIDSCYFLNGSQGSVTGNVTNGYVYGASTANFNSNVTNLYSYNDNPDAGPNIGVTGTVAYYMAEDSNDPNPPYGTHFTANTFSVQNGELKTASEHYTRDVSGGPASSNTPAASQPASTPKPAASGSSADEYDAVPKTGETSPVIWLSLIAVCCLGVSLNLRRSANQ